MAKENEKVVNDVTAEEMINQWMDHKKVRDRKREAYKQSIESLVDAAKDGELVLDKGFKLIYTLRHPIDNEVKTSKLEFKPRINTKELKRKTKGISAGDVEGRTAAYVAALTNQPVNLIEELDTEDNDIASSIAVFFM